VEYIELNLHIKYYDEISVGIDFTRDLQEKIKANLPEKKQKHLMALQ
jgi:hypothetical protein